jgi:hypothetical protein
VAGRTAPLAETNVTWLVPPLTLAQVKGTSALAGAAIARLLTAASSIKKPWVRKTIALLCGMTQI